MKETLLKWGNVFSRLPNAFQERAAEGFRRLEQEFQPLAQKRDASLAELQKKDALRTEIKDLLVWERGVPPETGQFGNYARCEIDFNRHGLPNRLSAQIGSLTGGGFPYGTDKDECGIYLSETGSGDVNSYVNIFGIDKDESVQDQAENRDMILEKMDRISAGQAVDLIGLKNILYQANGIGPQGNGGVIDMLVNKRHNTPLSTFKLDGN
ncbi:MAG: hypothetical protein K9G62_02090 [Alphaproteobacteria bacterium]|nr:hypothetical protein [Alphaproteobacteria bacterium]